VKGTSLPLRKPGFVANIVFIIEVSTSNLHLGDGKVGVSNFVSRFSIDVELHDLVKVDIGRGSVKQERSE